MEWFDSFHAMKWGVLWREMRVFAIGIKADGVAVCQAQVNEAYGVLLCLVAIVGKKSVVLRRVLLCCSFFLEVNLLFMDR